jgi:hypothetical protein
MTFWYRRVFLVLGPLFVECLVGSDEEALLGRRCFGEGIRNIGSKD